MENSKIEWTDFTFNPWWGCEKVSAGCKHCYAESLDNRYHHEEPHWGPGSSRKGMSPGYWKNPIKWNKDAAFSGMPNKVFCASMADIFEDHPQVTGWRNDLFDLIERTPNLIWQLLTKRPENIMRLAPLSWTHNGFPRNVWMGTSVENQEQALRRIGYLLEVNAHTLFLSCEPLLDRINLERVDVGLYHPRLCMVNVLAGKQTDMARPCLDTAYIEWVIVGAESGHGARKMNPDWAMDLKAQCIRNGTAFFMKQMAQDNHKLPFHQFPDILQLRQFPHFVRKTFNSSPI